MAEHLFAAVSSLAVVGLVGLGINYLLKDSIYQVIRREGLEPMEDEKDEGWGILVDRYRGDKHAYLVNVGEKELYSWCEKTLILNFSQDKYREVKKWCIRPKRNGEIIGEQETDLYEIKENDVEKWDAKVKEYSGIWRMTNDISMKKDGEDPVLKSDIDTYKLKI